MTAVSIVVVSPETWYIPPYTARLPEGFVRTVHGGIPIMIVTAPTVTSPITRFAGAFRTALFLLIGLVGTVLPYAVEAQSYDPTHAAFTKVLAAHVRDGKVDYKALKSNPAELTAYLDMLAQVQEATFKGWSKADQMAFLMNLYNATTLKLIVDNYPVSSIKDIGSFFKGPWKQSVVRVFGETKTLDNIEHDILRPTYDDARIHLALVCAAKSCPPLRSEAYVGSKLDAQFLDQGKVFFATPAKNQIDVAAKTMKISKIFDWFEKDFVQSSGSVEKFILPYVDPAVAGAIGAGGFSISYTNYDWSLNE
jgi:hypothetical protein